MKIVYAASEMTGFAKTGGLADVAAALPRALAERGHECTVFLPLYRGIRQGGHALQPTPHTLRIRLGRDTLYGALWRATLPESNVAVYLIAQPELFERDGQAGRGLYQYTLADGSKADYADNCARFIFFSRAILEALPLLGLWPDVLHLNDWQTGLVPVYLREWYSKPQHSEDAERYRRLRTLLTIHNIAYQGLFWHWDMPLTGLPWALFNHEQLEFHGHLSFLKAGIVYADLLNTVSVTYAREIQTPFYGAGLHGVLTHYAAKLRGVVNGIDERAWNPATDSYLPAHYDASTLAAGKAQCKQHLQQRLQLPQRPEVPLLGLVSRLVAQKGLEWLGAILEPFLQREDVQLVVLGEGDPHYHELLFQAQRRFPDKLAVRVGMDEALAHQIEAGADVFLMPSQFEPCGLNQMYSLKYGTVPLVRRTGGLTDTVTDTTEATLADGTATGFVFVVPSSKELLVTLERALRCYRTAPDVWRGIQQNGMRQDWSWRRAAGEYEQLYERLGI